MPCLQVVPTVGVGGEDAEKCAARMVKHFRNLVDETASKAKFLLAFQRGSAGGGGGGRERSKQEGSSSGLSPGVVRSEGGGEVVLGDAEEGVDTFTRNGDPLPG